MIKQRKPSRRRWRCRRMRSAAGVRVGGSTDDSGVNIKIHVCDAGYLYTEIACQRSCMGAVARASRIGSLFDPRAGSYLMQWNGSGAVAVITANLCDPETR